MQYKTLGAGIVLLYAAIPGLSNAMRSREVGARYSAHSQIDKQF
jgi:hypothetical protein